MKPLTNAAAVAECKDQFMVVDYETARAIGITDDDLFADHSWCLIERWGAGYRLVGQDGGEPEDQSLVRDWSWVCDELNRVACRYGPCTSKKA